MTAAIPAGTTAVGVPIPDGNRLNFVLCDGPAVKAEIIGHYEGEKNAVVLHKIDPADFIFNFSSSTL